MTSPISKFAVPGQQYGRNYVLARRFGVSTMTVKRWKHDPRLNTPPSMVVNGIEYNDLPAWDAWLKARAIDRTNRLVESHEETAA